MYPFVDIFGRTIGTYGIMVGIGIIVTGIVFLLILRKKEVYLEDVAMTGLFFAAGAVIGSHIVYGLTNTTKIIDLFRHMSEYSFIVMFDGVAIVIPLFHTFGRIGCFLGGCCFGVECKFGITIHNNTLYPAINDVNRLPIQLIEAGCNFILFWVLLFLYKKNKFQKRLLIVYLFAYPVIRFIDEFFRGDDIRGFLFGLSTSQIISILLFAFATVFTIIDLKKRKDTPVKTEQA